MSIRQLSSAWPLVSPLPTGNWEATTSPVLISLSLLCLAAAQAVAGKVARPQRQWRRGFILVLGHRRGACSGQQNSPDLCRPAGSGDGAASSGAERCGGGVWWWWQRHSRRLRRRRKPPDPHLDLAGWWPAAASGGGDGDGGRGGKERGWQPSAASGGGGGEWMASVRRTWPRRRQTQRPKESGGRGGGGEEFVATAVRATTVGRLRRVPSKLDDCEKVREDGKMAAGMEGQ
uniref:Uncharacterized protein n=1 Tax=Oryza meridionalis TaxID=40149 RepID=A0A0E0E0Q4_9ORYZ